MVEHQTSSDQSDGKRFEFGLRLFGLTSVTDTFWRIKSSRTEGILGTLSILYKLIRVRERYTKTALNLHLEKTSVIKNLNWPDECETRTSDNIILIYENEHKF